MSTVFGAFAFGAGAWWTVFLTTGAVAIGPRSRGGDGARALAFADADGARSGETGRSGRCCVGALAFGLAARFGGVVGALIFSGNGLSPGILFVIPCDEYCQRRCISVVGKLAIILWQASTCSFLSAMLVTFSIWLGAAPLSFAILIILSILSSAWQMPEIF